MFFFNCQKTKLCVKLGCEKSEKISNLRLKNMVNVMYTSNNYIDLVYTEHLILVLTSNFLLNYLNFDDACKCIHDTYI